MNIREFDLQPTLENEFVRIRPLVDTDFEELYTVASDPLIWEQHPNPDRYRREVFATFFKGALESGGAFMVYDRQTGALIGSSRYYGWTPEDGSVHIGYTFLARDHWGTTYNRALKLLMMQHAFQYADRVLFHIGAQNIRSQTAIQRLGAQKTREIEVEYYGESRKLNFEYEIMKTSMLPL